MIKAGRLFAGGGGDLMVEGIGGAIDSLRAGIGRAARFVKPKLADLADLAMVFVILGSLTVSVLNQSFIFTDKVLTGSIIGFGLSYLFASRSLRSRKEVGVERVFIGLGAMISSVWLFEIVWRLWGWDTWHLIREQLLTLSFANPWPLSWALLMVSLVFVGVRYMEVNRWFILVFVLAIATFQVWKSAGFPQFPHPEWWPSKHPTIPLIPIEYSHPTTEQGRATVEFWGALLNSVTKVFWCALPGTLFLTQKGRGGSSGARLWPPWRALKGLFLPWTDWDVVPQETGEGDSRHPSPTEPAAKATDADSADGSAAPAHPPRTHPNLCDLIVQFVRTKLADLADLFMVAVIVLAVAAAAANQTFVLTGRVLAASIVAYALCYLFASRRLRNCEGVGFERIFIAACAMVSGIWLFEVVYHYGWLVSWDQFSQSLTDFNIRPPALREPFPLMWASIMIVVVFVGARHMKANRWFYAVLAGSVAIFILWLAVGYPSFQNPWRSPQGTEVIQLIPPEWGHPRTPDTSGWGLIAFWGALFTGAAKLFICVLPATLFAHNIRRGRATSNAPPDDVLARAWKGAARRLGSWRAREPVDLPGGWRVEEQVPGPSLPPPGHGSAPAARLAGGSGGRWQNPPGSRTRAVRRDGCSREDASTR